MKAESSVGRMVGRLLCRSGPFSQSVSQSVSQPTSQSEGLDVRAKRDLLRVARRESETERRYGSKPRRDERRDDVT